MAIPHGTQHVATIDPQMKRSHACSSMHPGEQSGFQSSWPAGKGHVSDHHRLRPSHKQTSLPRGQVDMECGLRVTDLLWPAVARAELRRRTWLHRHRLTECCVNCLGKAGTLRSHGVQGAPARAAPRDPRTLAQRGPVWAQPCPGGGETVAWRGRTREASCSPFQNLLWALTACPEL